jgi:dipeptidase E
MRLYLSSYGLGKQPDEFVKLLRGKKRVGVIINAGDMDESYRPAGLAKQIDALTTIGLQPAEIDLRNYFNKPEALAQKLSEFDAVWVRGGNVFVLKRAIEMSGFDTAIRALLEQDVIVYGGYSAGALVTTPTLKGLEIVDNPNEVPPGYKQEFSWNGMALVPYSLAPHYKSDHPESAKIEKVVEYYKQHNMPHKTLSDGEVIVIDGQDERKIG